MQAAFEESEIAHVAVVACFPGWLHGLPRSARCCLFRYVSNEKGNTGIRGRYRQLDLKRPSGRPAAARIEFTRDGNFRSGGGRRRDKIEVIDVATRRWWTRYPPARTRTVHPGCCRQVLYVANENDNR